MSGPPSSRCCPTSRAAFTNDDGIVVRARRKLLKQINVIWVVESPLQKYFASPVGQIISTNSRHPTPPQGRIAIVTDAGCGCGGRGSVLRARRLRGGLRSVSDQQRADERCCSVRRSRVVLTPRRWRQVRGVASAQPGLDKTYPWTTVANKPGHRGEHEISRKTIACGNAGRFRCTRCYSCAFYQYQVHTRPRVQRAPGIPHALYGREIYQRLGRMARRGRERVFEDAAVADAFRHCEPTGRANARPMTGSAKQSIAPCKRKNGLLRRFAPRNDVERVLS